MKTRNVNTALHSVVGALLTQEGEQASRNGGTKEILNARITLTAPLEREILNPIRRASYPAQIAESMWILAGRNDVGWLAHYLPRAPQFSDDGETWAGGYGPRLRGWSTTVDRPHGTPGTPALSPGRFRINQNLDQLAHVVEMLKADPDTRRAVISIYDPARDSWPADADRKDIPCNDFLQFSLRDGVVHLSVFTRSNDIIWGWSGINQFEWSVLLEVVSTLVGAGVGTVTYNITSLHLYHHHTEKAQKLFSGPGEAYGDAYSFIRFSPAERTVVYLDRLLQGWFEAEELIRTANDDKTREAAMQAVRSFPEPLFRSWLRVLADWWGVEPLGEAFLDTQYHRALRLSPGKPQKPTETHPEPPKTPTGSNSFTRYLVNLHSEKNEVYGDSWKRRGEFMAILANIARKVDRLGDSGAGDTASDTVVDLLIYLVKYRAWLTEYKGAPGLPWYPLAVDGLSDDPTVVARHIEGLQNFPVRKAAPESHPILIRQIKETFDRLEDASAPGRWALVDDMIEKAYPVAHFLWWSEQNETRVWKGYEPEEGEALSGD